MLEVNKTILDNKGSVNYNINSNITARFESVGDNKVSCWLYESGAMGVSLSKEEAEVMISILQKQLKRMR